MEAGQEIAQIVPNDVALELRMLVPPQDIYKLKMGQTTQMRVSTCPYPDYGLLNGQVSRISRDVSQPNNRSLGQRANSSPTLAFYKIFIKPEAQSFGRNGYQCKLQLGMEGTAEIITRQETVLQFILRKARLIGNI